MIIEFSVSNNRSFAGEQVFSLVSDEANSLNKGRCSEINDGTGLKVLNTAVIYGANASGKSNLLLSMLDLKQMVLTSGKFDIDETIPFYSPFLLDKNFVNSETTFKMEFFTSDLYEDNKYFRYSYTISFNRKFIEREELVIYKSVKSTTVFVRERNQPIKWGAYLTGKKQAIVSSLLDNQLFLSVAGNSKDHPLNTVFRYFRDCIKFDGFKGVWKGDSAIGSRYPRQLRGENAKYYLDSIGDLLRGVDTGINGLCMKKNDHKIEFGFPENFPEEYKNEIIADLSVVPKAIHSVYENGGISGETEFDLSMESDGTVKFLEVGVGVLEAIRNGATLIVDEINQCLHPEITTLIVSLFQNKKLNKKNAQLIFSTHDVSILTPKLFGRDQVWFTEKEKCGATHIFALLEFDKDSVRKDSKFGMWYLQGKFGAIPIIDRLAIDRLIEGGDLKDA